MIARLDMDLAGRNCAELGGFVWPSALAKAASRATRREGLAAAVKTNTTSAALKPLKGRPAHKMDASGAQCSRLELSAPIWPMIYCSSDDF